ncbi:MAG: hypothetical protein KGJ02_03730 [Verrucomicrobiota bacterium]|nr:hypothetical protein [Verrucomicrobiota bacterium]
MSNEVSFSLDPNKQPLETTFLYSTSLPKEVVEAFVQQSGKIDAYIQGMYVTSISFFAPNGFPVAQIPRLCASLQNVAWQNERKKDLQKMTFCKDCVLDSVKVYQLIQRDYNLAQRQFRKLCKELKISFKEEGQWSSESAKN